MRATQATTHAGASPQPALSDRAETRCGFSEVFQWDGWKIPGLRGASQTKERYVFPDAPGVTASRLVPGRSVTKLPILRCASSSSGRIEFRLRYVKVLELWRCEYHGRVFAYAAEYEPQVMEKGILHPLLESVLVLFYDLDGTGEFASMRYASGLLFKALDVPDWVKAK